MSNTEDPHVTDRNERTEMTDDVTATTQTLARIAHAMDSGPTPDELLGLLAADIRWQLPGGGEPMSGQEAMREWLTSRRASGHQGPGSGIRHLLASVVMEVDGSVAHGRAYFTMVRSTSDGVVIAAAGTYDDELVRDGDRWLLRRRTIITDG